MILIENVKVEGFEPAIRGMRNALESWDKSDSKFYIQEDLMKIKIRYHDINGHGGWMDWSKWEDLTDNDITSKTAIGPDDLALMQKLIKSGSDHCKWRRMIVVWLDITAPLYWWKEFETYRIGVVRPDLMEMNSCSTMHKIHAREFTPDDFSHEHIISWETTDENSVPVVKRQNAMHEFIYNFSPNGNLELVIDMLNECRKLYLETKDKKYWWQMIQLLPTSYNQRRTIMFNYEVLSRMYAARNSHKLDEWRDFCNWVEFLPYAKELIIGKENKNE